MYALLIIREGGIQHFATHCNTLQHTTTRCITLQHTTSHTLRHTATRCNTLQHAATRCNTLQHAATHCNTLQRTTIQRNTPQYTIIHRNTLQHTAWRCKGHHALNSISPIGCDSNYICGVEVFFFFKGFRLTFVRFEFRYMKFEESVPCPLHTTKSLIFQSGLFPY